MKARELQKWSIPFVQCVVCDAFLVTAALLLK